MKKKTRVIYGGETCSSNLVIRPSIVYCNNCKHYDWFGHGCTLHLKPSAIQPVVGDCRKLNAKNNCPDYEEVKKEEVKIVSRKPWWKFW